jgi:hypothetical protein
MFDFGESGVKRTMAGITFGVGIAISAIGIGGYINRTRCRLLG